MRSETSPADALDLEGRRYAITGANTGVGRATAVALVARGAEVIVACRSRERTQGTLTDAARVGRGSATFVALDLASLGSVVRAADEIGRLAPRLDGLILNAGVAGARGATREGFELAFGVNHLGHFALAQRVLPSLGPEGRVVHLGSGSHQTAPRPDLDALRAPTRSLTGIREYAVSKLCVMLFHRALAARLGGHGPMSVVADPGDVASDAWRHVPWPVRALITRRMASPAEGARASLRCATSAEVRRGGCYRAEGEAAVGALACDDALAAELWERSEAWTRG